MPNGKNYLDKPATQDGKDKLQEKLEMVLNYYRDVWVSTCMLYRTNVRKLFTRLLMM